RTFKGAGHEWHLRLPRSAVSYLPITNMYVTARATASIRNRFLAPFSRKTTPRELKQFTSRRRSHMKVAKCPFPSVTLGLALFSVLVLGTPLSGFAQNPHTCKSDWLAHLPTNLGNKPSFDFYFHKNCPPYTSNTINWTFQVFDNVTGNQIPGCIWGPYNLPPNTQGPKTCSPLPRGIAARIKVVINYKVPPDNPMVHSHIFYNY
ncbi:MAG: hypothetical protein ACRD5H_17525, partial [Nitrososphaerales archaeon]